GIMMAMVRLNCPSVFVYGGAMLPGRWRGRDATVLTAYEAVGSVLTGAMSGAELAELERARAPTIGSCPGRFTPNTKAQGSPGRAAGVRWVGPPRYRRRSRRSIPGAWPPPAPLAVG